MQSSIKQWKNTFSAGSFFWADFIVLGFVVTFFWCGFYFWQEGNKSFQAIASIPIDLSSLPRYAMLSLARSLIALVISTIIAIIYATVIARSHVAEKFLLPLLDVLQSLPMLTFLPGIVLTLTHLFPSSRWGLEFSCVLLLVTCQVWNLVFAYYESQKAIPREFIEIAQLGKLSFWQRFKVLDFPNGLRPLVYNGMMSMAGGWFFLALSESFEISNQKYQLPGLGSFLSLSYQTQDYRSFMYGLATMALMIIGVDFVLWKPLTVWIGKFAESPNSAVAPKSLFVSLLQKADITDSLKKHLFDFIQKYTQSDSLSISKKLGSKKQRSSAGSLFRKLTKPFIVFFNTLHRHRKGLNFCITLLLGALTVWAAPHIPEIIASIGTIGWDKTSEIFGGLCATMLRVLAVLVISSAWTIPVGIWIGSNLKVAKYMLPLIQNLAAFPAPVLFPFLSLGFSKMSLAPWFSATLLMTIGNQWYMLFNVISGTVLVEQDHKIVSNVYGLNWLNKFRYLYFPALLPSLLTGWFSAAGGAWNSSIVAEFVEFPGGSLQTLGIGNQIARATAKGDFLVLGAAVVAVSFAIIIINRMVWSNLPKLLQNR